MLKLLNKIFLSSVIVCFLAFNTLAFAEEETIPPAFQEENQMELIQNDIKVEDPEIDPIDTQKVKKTVVPDTKKESKKVISLFLKAMASVLFCAVIVYVVLLFVKKFYGSAFMPEDEEEFEALDLTAPSNKQEALKSFLNRTK